MPLQTELLEPGDIVSYEDMANPRTTYQVIEVVRDRWGTFYRLNILDERYENAADLKTSDCRQYGWNLAVITDLG
jgi:hypothetical protein